MTKLPNFAYDWMIDAKEEGLTLIEAINENHTESYTFDNWITSNSEHLKDFANAWCGDDIEIIEEVYRIYYLDTTSTKHYMKSDFNSTTDKLLSAQFTKPEWEAVFHKAIISGFLQFEKVGD